MTTIPQLPSAASVGPTDLLPLSQNGVLYAASVQQVTAGLQQEISLPTGDLLGRNSAGAGTPEAVAPGTGLALGGGTLSATGTDHLGFPVLGTLSTADEVVVNAQGAPGRLPVTELRGLFSAGAGLAIDANGTLSVTASAIAGPTGPAGPAGVTGPAGPAGPAGPTGQGLAAPGATNSASTIGTGDFVAIWQNGANAWVSYEKLVGGQTIDQLPAAGPAADSDLMLVAQGGNALASQSFAAIWTYVAQKIPTMRRQVVELNSNTVLDATTHNQRILVVSQPITLTANFTNMGSGFTCRVINLASGPVKMGTGITSGTGVGALPPGTAAELTALTYSGGSLVWWDGIAMPTPTITVNAPGTPLANAAFTVSGDLFDETPTALDYSTDATTWTAAAAPTIGAGSYSFQMPGLPAGTYTIAVRDHNATGVVGRSAPFSVVAAAVSLGIVPASATAGGNIAVSGTVAPAGAAVQVGLSASATTPPASFVAATVSGGTWSATLPAGSAGGTAYLWAEQTADTAVTAVSGAIAVTAATPSVTYTVNQPATTSVAAGSGTLALNGGISPAQAIATQVAFSTSGTTPPSSGWQAASIIDNNGLWAVYATIPATAGAYYVWVETATGQAAVVSGFTITVT
ncbi:collagen-like protein [Acidiphilium sp.]|uniref:collagen-like protein n=1 Tax=Acidiphilium sp. TaxID=527 RepID=UPI00258CB2EF|nr:collagen-like protein [Acidiphilium sp.]